MGLFGYFTTSCYHYQRLPYKIKLWPGYFTRPNTNWHMTSIYTKPTLGLFSTVFYHECPHRPLPWVVSENWQKSKVRPAGSLGLGRVSQSRQVHISYDWADMGKNILHISPCLVRDWQNSWLLIVMLYNSCWKKVAWAVKISWYRHQRLGFTAKPVPLFRMWTEKRRDCGTSPIKFAGDWPSKLFRSTVI